MLDYITDYDHLNLHYDRLCGKKIGTCKFCSKLFKQSDKRPAMYCYKHRGYNKIGSKILVCIDCGKNFCVGSKSRRKKDVMSAKKSLLNHITNDITTHINNFQEFN